MKHESTTVKLSLNSFCKDPYLYHRIQEEVKQNSLLSAEGSLYNIFIFMKNCMNKCFEYPNIHKNYDSLTNKVNTLDAEYAKIRQKYKLPKSYNVQQNTKRYTASQLDTNFRVNISTHAYKRIDRFLKHLLPTAKTYEILDTINKKTMENNAENLRNRRRI